MSRITLTDGSGNWFESSKAIRYKEGKRWNGNNYISMATNSQWEHECLYYTKSGRWVLNSWSNYQGTLESYSEISEGEAIDWLISQAYLEVDELPKSIRESVLRGIELAEI